MISERVLAITSSRPSTPYCRRWWWRGGLGAFFFAEALGSIRRVSRQYFF